MRCTTTVVAITLSVLAAVLTAPAQAATREPDAPASAGWHGRAVEDPRPAPKSVRATWPPGWGAGAVRRGTGYVRPGGSRRVRDVQRRLTKLGYRPGPVDGLFGPRTEAAARWFQYKHGLRTSGRVDRLTLAVLRSRSDHRPLERVAPKPPESAPAPEPPPATNTPASGDDGTSLVPYALLIAAALLAGLLVGTLLPRRRRATTPVLGYVARGGSDEVAAAAPALEHACARRDWSLVRIVQETDDAGAGIAERPGLLHAIREIEAGEASGLVVPRLRDFTTRLADLAALMQWLGDADGFLAAVDDELDTSTPGGRDGRRGDRHRELAAAAVQRPAPRATSRLEPRLAALKERSLPDTSIADALNLAGVPGPRGNGWEAGDVAAASRRAQEAPELIRPGSGAPLAIERRAASATASAARAWAKRAVARLGAASRRTRGSGAIWAAHGSPGSEKRRAGPSAGWIAEHGAPPRCRRPRPPRRRRTGAPARRRSHSTRRPGGERIRARASRGCPRSRRCRRSCSSEHLDVPAVRGGAR